MKRDMTDRGATPGEELYTTIAVRLLAEPDIDEGRLFSAQGLRTHGKIFAMLTRGDRLTVKLPAERCAELVDAGAAVRFEAGGKQLREWVSLVDPSEAEAAVLADEALAFVRALFGLSGGRGS